jgi:hypothetical protein
VTTVGVLGGDWRATVDERGRIEPWDGSPTLNWWVAADDRWHVAAQETTVRQVRRDGTPVLESRLRIPQGDAVHRVYAVADAGGLTVIEVENDSSLPIAVAFDRADLLTARPPTSVPAQGIDLPPDAVVHPVGHHSTLRVAIAHGAPRTPARLPEVVPQPAQVVRGWLAQTERASRLVLPESALVERIVHERCELLLGGVADAQDDPIGYLLGVDELGRLGVDTSEWVPDVVTVAEAVARAAARAGSLSWEVDRALVATSDTLARCHESRGVDDVAELRRRLGGRGGASLAAPAGLRAIAWTEDRLARPLADGTCALLPGGVPSAWLGQSFETYRLPAGGGRCVSFAVRWHGERPALLWEVTGPPGLRLTGGGADPSWSTTEARGEALLAPPPHAPLA